MRRFFFVSESFIQLAESVGKEPGEAMEGGAPMRQGRRVWQCNPALGHKDEAS